MRRFLTQTVSHVVQAMRSALEWREAINLATGLQSTVAKDDIAKIEAFWAAVQSAALETIEEEEEEDLLLLS